MRSFLPAVLAAVTLAACAASNGFAYGLCDLIGCPRHDCGCSCEADCSCEAECCCEPCNDAGCGCEPCCGCSSGCCCDGRQFAGQTYDCGCESQVPWCPCTGPECCEPNGCGGCCEPCCDDCCCEPSCGSGCGGCCEPCCPPGNECCLKHCGFGHVCWEIVDCLSSCCCSGCGCDEEVYWSEWHNDPPRCCDPCDCYGNWTGPGNGPYRAPYAHGYAPHGYSDGGYAAAGRPTSQHAPAVQYARKNVKNGSYAKRDLQRRLPPKHAVARQDQPAQGTIRAAHNRGAAAIVIQR